MPRLCLQITESIFDACTIIHRRRFIPDLEYPGHDSRRSRLSAYCLQSRRERDSHRGDWESRPRTTYRLISCCGTNSPRSFPASRPTRKQYLLRTNSLVYRRSCNPIFPFCLPASGHFTMWDVIWTDPDRELVGEHRAKKGRSQEEKEKNGIGSGRNSAATSHSSSSSESPFGFFRSKASRRADAPNKSTPVRPPSLSGLASPSLLSSLSPFSQTFDAVSRRSSGIITTAPTSPNKDTLEVGRYSSENTDIRAGHISFTSCTSGGQYCHSRTI